MTSRPRTSLGRVLDDLGGTLLELAHGSADTTRDIGGVVIHDQLDELFLPSHALVLGVGMAEVDSIVELLDELGRRGAAGLILRARITDDPAIGAATERSGVPVLGLTRGASWDQLAAMLRALLAEGDLSVSETESLGGLPSGDLFALANAISALLDAPITIEDRASRVVAFSGRQDEADQGRIETVLGRQVPERYARVLTERGVFRDLYHSTSPVRVEPVITGDKASMPRVAVAVRAGDEILGSIWAVTSRPMSEERLEALQDAAKVVALHLLRVRAGADVEHRLRADLVSTALEGGAGAREALRRLGLADEPVLVLALAVADDDGSGSPEAAAAIERGSQQLSNAFAMHLSAVHPRASSALIGRVAYGLLPSTVGDDQSEQRAVRIATDFLDRLGDRVRAFIGVGSVAANVGELSYARVCADRALRVLRESETSARVARLADVQMDAAVLELRDMMVARGDRPSGAVALLIDHDGRHGGILVRTLRAWLDAFGDVSAASAAVGVHPNTFRYRLRRAAEVSGIDLGDANSRFVAMLQLRVLWPSDDPPPR